MGTKIEGNGNRNWGKWEQGLGAVGKKIGKYIMGDTVCVLSVITLHMMGDTVCVLSVITLHIMGDTVLSVITLHIMEDTVC